VRDFENSLEIPATPSSVGRLSAGAGDMGQQELNTSAFEERLVRQVREIVSMRQQEIRKTEENLSMALKELQVGDGVGVCEEEGEGCVNGLMASVLKLIRSKSM
jgi:hypothetical protein